MGSHATAATDGPVPATDLEVLAQSGAFGLTLELDQYLRLFIKPKPRFLPQWVYARIIGRIVMYQSIPVLTDRSAEDAASGFKAAMQARRDNQLAGIIWCHGISSGSPHAYLPGKPH